ncbi:hypothetical protein SAMN02745823_01592 [Sporobacter termitidis DSM 10068]|uniref:Uncharacterized protein n=1 Tax=Sporobacter termitidis DSM 10068 TaxID=1123282 RepID=A0A1M5X490_9FIRM|nr:NAD(P)H-dependent oxidoreductase [Sporobacter termitidis]SHH94627.1 hypothetical protein SAMN02745823_01592 [Sporobacter termitidis DSM 10068]
MKAFVVSDEELRSARSAQINDVVRGFLKARGYGVEEAHLDRDTLKCCMGCFGCWVKKPGVCVIGDGMSSVNNSAMTSDAVFYICPIVFGQFSANIKNAVDRWLPNMLPFFETRPDGSTMHPPRYIDYPCQIMIGYGENLTREDARLFTDIIKKHRGGAEVLICGDPAELPEALGRLSLSRIGGHL